MDTTSLPQTYKALTAQKNGGKPTFEELPLPRPGKNQVLVKMAFVPINPSDILVIEGAYRHTAEPPFLIGLEGSGTVAAVGEDLKYPHKVGDKVHVHCRGSYGQYSIMDSEDCSPILGDLSLEEAASHIVNPGTVAWMAALAERGGHKAAISTAASSALGKMLIRYLKQKGIKTINTVRQDKYIEELKKEGADYVLNSEAPDFEAQLKEIAAKEGATIAFDAIGGDFTNKVIRNQPPNSTCHVYGVLAGGEISDIFQNKKLEDGKTVQGLIYLSYIKEFSDRGELDKYYTEIHTPLTTAFKTHIHQIFPFEKIHEALDYYRANASKGKILIKFD